METTASPRPKPEGKGELERSFYPARITSVEADASGLTDGRRRIRVSFDDGACRLFDLGPYLERPVFGRLLDEEYFASVAPDGPYAVAWPDGEDLSCGTIYHAGFPCDH